MSSENQSSNPFRYLLQFIGKAPQRFWKGEDHCVGWEGLNLVFAKDIPSLLLIAEGEYLDVDVLSPGDPRPDIFGRWNEEPLPDGLRSAIDGISAVGFIRQPKMRTADADIVTPVCRALGLTTQEKTSWVVPAYDEIFLVREQPVLLDGEQVWTFSR